MSEVSPSYVFQNIYKKDLLTDLATVTDQVDALRVKADRISADDACVSYQDYTLVRRYLAQAVERLDEAKRLLDA